MSGTDRQRHRAARRLTQLFFACAAISVSTACSRMPSYVISPDDMAELLADIHTGESIIEQNYSEFRSDSAKRALKMSVYNLHGVTPEQVDTSLMWYGHHLDKYNDVYDRTIEILEDRVAHVKTTAAMEAMAIAGDSVDVWNGAQHLTIASTSPTQYLSFALDRDENWEPGDVYAWRFKTINNSGNLTLSVLVDYADGAVEHSFSTTAADGWHSVQLSTDSLREARRVYGFVRLLPPHNDGYLYIDSISLVRNRVSEATYVQRFRQRKYGEAKQHQSYKDAPSPNTEPPRAIPAENLKIIDN